MPYPSKGAEPGSLLNSEIIQSPPQHMWLVSTPFETCGGVPGAPIEIWTLASQVPSARASVALVAGGLCALAQEPARPTAEHATLALSEGTWDASVQISMGAPGTPPRAPPRPPVPRGA